MKNQNTAKVSAANNVLVSGGLTLTVFWVLNILKTAYPTVKNFLTLYKPIGPLLGLYLISILFFISFMLILKSVKIKNQTSTYWIYVISVILFVIMVFPPFFEPIVHILTGNSSG